jgi:hypothetical protein
MDRRREQGVEQDRWFLEVNSPTASRSKGRERVSHKREAEDECSSLPPKKGNFVLHVPCGKIERQLDVVEDDLEFNRQWCKPVYSSGHDVFKRPIEDDAGFLVATKRCRLEDAVGWSLVLSRPESVMVLEDKKEKLWLQDTALSCVSRPEFKLEPPQVVVLCDVKQWLRERLATALPLLENARGGLRVSMEVPRVEVLDSSDDEQADQEGGGGHGTSTNGLHRLAQVVALWKLPK